MDGVREGGMEDERAVVVHQDQRGGLLPVLLLLILRQE